MTRWSGWAAALSIPILLTACSGPHARGKEQSELSVHLGEAGAQGPASEQRSAALDLPTPGQVQPARVLPEASLLLPGEHLPLPRAAATEAAAPVETSDGDAGEGAGAAALQDGGETAKPDPEDSSEEVLRDPVKSEIAILVRTFYQSYNERDFTAAKACFWPNATITEVRELAPGEAPRVVVLGAPTFFKELEELARGAGDQRFGRLAKEPKWRFASNVAQAWCEFLGQFSSGEEVMTWKRYDAFTFVHHEGKWLIAALVQSLSVDGE